MLMLGCFCSCYLMFLACPINSCERGRELDETNLPNLESRFYFLFYPFPYDSLNGFIFILILISYFVKGV